ncbi:hypothetical protein C8A01DRAFT_20627 [Parachaetomium inaequale]|uniref:Transmembrane protein n=1 Tax=Parachaetomium inaequale TaxID=2588326 RepID=A0AAN6P8H2_9PEZI|nr:hypothetical protein C8A01DRAFT_20627 [Parachaetomium inaequale]
MGQQISVPIAIAAIVATAVGTCLLSLLGYYLFTRRRKAKHREHEEEKEVNAALDRAIVSYIVKELPSPHGSAAPPPDRPQQSQPPPAMTTAVDAKMDSAEDGGLVVHSPQPPLQEEPRTTPTADQRQSLPRSETSMTGTSTTGTSRPLRQTASSHFIDSAERVYASILASPLERLKTRSSPQQEEPVPAARDDVGWPLPARESWL